MAAGLTSGFLNLGIVVLFAVGLVLAVRRLDRNGGDGTGPSAGAEPRTGRVLRGLEDRLIRLRHR
jgi:hypothetical protein